MGQVADTMSDLGVSHSHRAQKRMLVKLDSIPMLSGLSPERGKTIVARFDGACMSSNGGFLASHEVEQWLAITSRLEACIHDPRDPGRVVHGQKEIICTRMLMIAAGHEDGNDPDRLRHDPMFKLAMGRLPIDADLCSQPTISRLENLPDARALLRMGRNHDRPLLPELSPGAAPHHVRHRHTFDAVHGGKQLRLFNAHHDEYGFQPIVVFDGEGCIIAALLRPACRPSRRKIVFWLRRLIVALRNSWPRVEILLRADSHYCTPEVLCICRAEQLDYVIGVAQPSPCANTSLRWKRVRSRAPLA